jgi:hypothetical protein
MRTQLTLDALAVVGAVTVAGCVLGLATVGVIDAGRWLLARADGWPFPR